MEDMDVLFFYSQCLLSITIMLPNLYQKHEYYHGRQQIIKITLTIQLQGNYRPKFIGFIPSQLKGYNHLFFKKKSPQLFESFYF